MLHRYWKVCLCCLPTPETKESQAIIIRYTPYLWLAASLPTYLGTYVAEQTNLKTFQKNFSKLLGIQAPIIAYIMKWMLVWPFFQISLPQIFFFKKNFEAF